MSGADKMDELYVTADGEIVAEKPRPHLRVVRPPPTQRDVILGIFDRLGAPKVGEDLADYASTLHPPPGDPRAAHRPRCAGCGKCSRGCPCGHDCICVDDLARRRGAPNSPQPPPLVLTSPEPPPPPRPARPPAGTIVHVRGHKKGEAKAWVVVQPGAPVDGVRVCLLGSERWFRAVTVDLADVVVADDDATNKHTRRARRLVAAATSYRGQHHRYIETGKSWNVHREIVGAVVEGDR